MQNSVRTLGPNEARVILGLQAEAEEFITLARVGEIIGGEQVRARKVLHALVNKGWLVKLGAGKYALVPADRGPENIGENNALAMASMAVESSYVGWWSAASFHGFTTQHPSRITVASTRQIAEREIEGNRVHFVKVSPQKFFGGTPYEVFGRTAVISNPQKTLADCIDRPDLCGGLAEVVRITYGAMSKVAPDKFVETATTMGSVSLMQRSGFLFDLVGWEIPSAVPHIKT